MFFQSRLLQSLELIVEYASDCRMGMERRRMGIWQPAFSVEKKNMSCHIVTHLFPVLRTGTNLGQWKDLNLKERA